jgi:hypothetical protein
MGVGVGAVFSDGELIAAAGVAAGFSIGLAPTSHADETNRQGCLAVMAMSVNPYDPNDHYALNMLEQFPKHDLQPSQ